jgi:hypothetical protein
MFGIIQLEMVNCQMLSLLDSYEEWTSFQDTSAKKWLEFWPGNMQAWLLCLLKF